MTNKPTVVEKDKIHSYKPLLRMVIFDLEIAFHFLYVTIVVRHPGENFNLFLIFIQSDQRPGGVRR